MKKISVFGLFLLLATACGGRTGDLDNNYPQETSVGGGGSVCATTTGCATGGSASTSTETSSPSTASNATGGESSSNATTQTTTTVAGTTSIATSVTGSSSSTGGDAVTGGAPAVGTSSSANCAFDLSNANAYAEFTAFSSDAVTPGTNAFKATEFNLATRCQQTTLRELSFKIQDLDLNYTSDPNGTLGFQSDANSVVQNFINFRLVNTKTGATIGGPTQATTKPTVYETQFPYSRALVYFKDIEIPKGESVPVALVMDVPATFSANTAVTHYRVYPFGIADSLQSSTWKLDQSLLNAFTVTTTGGTSSGTGGASSVSSTGGTSSVSATGGNAATGGTSTVSTTTDISKPSLLVALNPQTPPGRRMTIEQANRTAVEQVSITYIQVDLTAEHGNAYFGGLTMKRLGTSTSPMTQAWLFDGMSGVEFKSGIDNSKGTIQFVPDTSSGVRIVRSGETLSLGLLVAFNVQDQDAEKTVEFEVEDASQVHADVRIDGSYPIMGNTFTFTNIHAMPHLYVELMHDTPSSHIVVPNAAGTYEKMTTYSVQNDGLAIGSIGSVVVSRMDPNGTLTDCDAVGLFVDGSLCSVFYSVDGTNIKTNVPNATCNKDIYPTGAVVVDVGCIVAKPVEPSLAQAFDPKSGDIIALKITSITANDGSSGYIVEHNVPSMTLHKSAPIITWLPIAEPLHVGVNTIAKLHVANASSLNPLGMYQMLFDISSSGVTYETILRTPPTTNSDYSNNQAYYVDGVLTGPNSVLWGSNPTYGIFIPDVVNGLTVQPGGSFDLELRVNVTSVSSGSWIKTQLGTNTGVYKGFLYLAGMDFPGRYVGKEPNGTPWWGNMFWTDFSAGDGHSVYTRSATTSDYQTSSDFLSDGDVIGIDGNSTVTAP